MCNLQGFPATIGSERAKMLSYADISFVDSVYPDLKLQYTFSDNEITGLSVVGYIGNPVSLVIPDSVTSIAGLFDCTSLQSITIPDSVTRIGRQAFAGCTSLQSINIPNSVTSIGILAFWNCTSLQSIIIPDSVTSIGDSAFGGCDNLKGIPATIGSELARLISNASASFVDSAYPNLQLQYTFSDNEITGLSVVGYVGNPVSIIIPNSVTRIGY